MKRSLFVLAGVLLCIFYLDEYQNSFNSSLIKAQASEEVVKSTKLSPPPGELSKPLPGNRIVAQKTSVVHGCPCGSHGHGSNSCENEGGARSGNRVLNTFDLVVPDSIAAGTLAIGDVVNVAIGNEEYDIVLTTAARMSTGYLYEGTVGNSGSFYLSVYNEIITGHLIPAGDGENGFTIDSREIANSWQEKKKGAIVCSGPSSDNHAFNPIEFNAETGGVSAPIPLHESNPEAIGVIYLDYDDHRLDSQGIPQPGRNPWNKVATTEQMTYVWEAVAEHFSYFEVNVTTDENVYLSAPPTQRIRCRFANENGTGKATLGGFADPGDGDLCLVAVRLGAPREKRNHEKNLADIIYIVLHEVGHSMGLNHDGPQPGVYSYSTGHGDIKNHWAPIMGNGYSKRFWQWSKGDFGNIWNKEDDLFVIQKTGQFTYKPDDHSNNLDESATPIEDAALQEWDGILEKEGDVDVFAIDIKEAGIVDIDVCTKVLGALNVDIEVVDENNESQFSTVDFLPDESKNDRRHCYLTPGNYYLVVKATGTKYYNTYATLGSYKIDYSFSPGERSEHRIVASSNVGGSIDLNGSEKVFSGDNRTIQINTDAGHKIASLRVNGVELQLNKDERILGHSHTFENIDRNLTIEVIFELAESDVDVFLNSSFNTSNVFDDIEEVAHGGKSKKLIPFTGNGDTKNKLAYMEYSEDFLPGEVSFYYKVSSQDGSFRFLVNGQVVLEQLGYSDWQKFTYSHEGGILDVRWQMLRRNYLTVKEVGEAAWVDNISFPSLTVNKAPLTSKDSYSFLSSENSQLNASFSVLENDRDFNNDSLTADLKSTTKNGQLSFNSDGTFTYSPNSGFYGTDTFTYVASDGTLRSEETVEITVLPPSIVRGGVKYDHWDGIGGNNVSSLTGNARYPSSPNFSGELSSLHSPGGGNNYGARAHGYLIPPATGLYKFWISGDHQAQLWLSPGGKESNKVQIASVNRVTPGNWDVFPSQKSVTLNLVAGQAYFIEALLKEGGGPDHLSVAWQGPGIPRQIISGQYLAAKLASAPKAYDLSVTSGSGSGSYVAGTVVNLVASSAPVGHKFDVWVGDVSGISDASSASTQLTMPSSPVSVRATYKKVEPQAYVLTVTSGSGSGSYVAGSVVDLAAFSAPAGYEFDRWVGDVSGISNVSSASTQLSMPSSPVSVRATYKKVEPQTYTLTVTSGSGSGSYVAGAVVNLVASSAPSGQEFDVWVGDVSGVSDVSSASTQLTMPSSTVLIQATYKKKSAVLTGFLNQDYWKGIPTNNLNTLLNNPDYPLNPSASTEITSFEFTWAGGNNFGARLHGYLVPPVSGDYTFWIAGDQSFRLNLSTDSTEENKREIAGSRFPTGWRNWDSQARQKSVSISLVAGQAYFIEALLKESGGNDYLAVAWEGPRLSREIIAGKYLAKELPTFYDLSVTSGSGSGSYVAGAVVDLVASEAPVGYEFDVWAGDVSGVSDVTSASTQFTVGSSDARISATYKKKTVGVVTGFLNQDYWKGIPTNNLNTLLNNPDYPLNPSASTEITSFEFTWAGGNNFGARLHGYLVPPVSGDYTFWIAGDQSFRLNLSTDSTEENKREIAGSRFPTGWRNWDSQARQKSVSISLVAGQAYFIEALLKESGGNDYLAVAWEGPGLSREIIAGKYLAKELAPVAAGPSVEIASPQPLASGPAAIRVDDIPVVGISDRDSSLESGAAFLQSVLDLSDIFTSSQDLYILLSDDSVIPIILSEDVEDVGYDFDANEFLIDPRLLNEPLTLQELISVELLIDKDEFWIFGVKAP